MDFKFPDLGEGITEGEIRKWLIREGDEVKQDQSIAEVETDKAVVEIPAPAAGKITKIYFPEGSVIKVGQVLVTIGGGAAAQEPEARKPSVSVVGELPEAPAQAPIVVAKSAPQATAEGVLATPAVRKLAKDIGVNISSVKGTGPNERVTEDDVRGAKATPPATQKPKVTPKFDIYGYVERRPLKGIRRTTARHMAESITKAAHVTAMDYADVTELVQLRERHKEALKAKGTQLTYMPFVIKAIVEALRENPILNSTYDEEAEEVVIKKYYNIGIAVATEDGLIVPVVKGADQKSIVELAEEVHRLSELAASRKIDLGDLKGGTFTITNYGVFGGTYGTPIINYPEAAILGTGRIQDAPLVVDGEVKARKVMHLSLSFDHKIMDGADAAKFMNLLKKYLEDPELLMISIQSVA